MKVLKNASRNTLQILSVAGCVLALSGCGDETDEMSLETSAMSPKATVLSDLEYMRSIAHASAEPGVRIDFSDFRQYRFVMDRLKSTGRTFATEPELFEELAHARQLALEGRMPEASNDTSAHMIANILQDPSDVDRISVDAFATVRGGAPTSYLDVSIFSDTGAQIGETIVEQRYNEGTNMKARVTGKMPSGKGNTGYVIVDTLACNNATGVQECSIDSVGTNLKKPGRLQAPFDQQLPGVPLDGIITVCLNRSWLYDAYDCEYKQDNTGGNILFPLKGEMDFDGDITKLKKAWIKLSMANNGGSCKPSLDFTSQLQLDPNVKGRVKWNIPTANFGRNCFAHQADVNINIGIEVDVNLNGETNLSGFGTISSQASSSNATIPQIQFANSCLAAGTMIRMADGSQVAVEKVGQEDRVLSDVDGLALSVMDLSLGIEDVPMIRLEDNLGHSLLLTDGHPVISVDGVKRADELEPGELVYTEDGVALLTKVSFEVYDGSVHNFKLGNGFERKLIGAEETTLFANGFMVGDGRIQADIAFRNDVKPAWRSASKARR